MTWTYQQSTGKLFDPDGDQRWTGYSGGNCGKNPDGVNNPAMENVACVGPLPVGNYTFGTPVEHSRLGPFAIPLHPAQDNVMFGRGGFFMHGDTTPSGNASEGCVIMPRMIRIACWAHDDHNIDVIA